MQRRPRIIFDDLEKNASFWRKIDQVKKQLNRGVIVEISNPFQAMTAELAGVKAVLVVGEQSKIPVIAKEVKEAVVNIQVMVKVQLGHLGLMLASPEHVDFVEESNVFDSDINKHEYDVSFVCGCENLGEVLSVVNGRAALIRIQGGPGTMQTRTKARSLMRQFGELKTLNEDQMLALARESPVPYDFVARMKELDRFPVVLYADGGICGAGDALGMMEAGCDGVFVGKDVWEHPDPRQHLWEMVMTVMYFNEPTALHNILNQ